MNMEVPGVGSTPWPENPPQSSPKEIISNLVDSVEQFKPFEVGEAKQLRTYYNLLMGFFNGFPNDDVSSRVYQLLDEIDSAATTLQKNMPLSHSEIDIINSDLTDAKTCIKMRLSLSQTYQQVFPIYSLR